MIHRIALIVAIIVWSSVAVVTYNYLDDLNTRLAETKI